MNREMRRSMDKMLKRMNAKRVEFTNSQRSARKAERQNRRLGRIHNGRNS